MPILFERGATRRRPRRPWSLGAAKADDPVAKQAAIDEIKANAVEVVALRQALADTSASATPDQQASIDALVAEAQKLADDTSAQLAYLDQQIAAKKALLPPGVSGLGVWSTFLDAEVPVLLKRADYDATRRNFYRTTGMARDDAKLPLPIPPGAVVLHSQDGNPANDAAMTPSGARAALQPTAVQGTNFTIPSKWVWVSGDYGDPTQVGDIPALLLSLGLVVTPQTIEIVQSFRNSGVQVTASGVAAAAKRWYGITLPPPTFQAAPALPDDPTWWYGTPWGQDHSPDALIPFVAPLVLGQYGWEPTTIVPLPADEQYALARNPHPYIVGMPAGEPIDEPFCTSSGQGDSGNYACHPVSRYHTPVVLINTNDRHKAQWAGAPFAGWAGFYMDASTQAWWEQVLSTIAREAAVQVLVSAVGAILTAGAAAPLIQAGFNLAANYGAGQVVDAGYRASGADVTGGDSRILEGSLTASSGSPAASAVANTVADFTPTVAAVAPVAAPEITNKVLVAAADASVYFDDLTLLSQLYTLALRELTVLAQQTRAERDALRIDLAKRRAELTNSSWYRAAVIGLQALKTVASLGASSGLDAATVALAQALNQIINVAVGYARLYEQVQAAKALAKQVADERQKQLDDIQRKIDVIVTHQPPPDVPSQTGSSWGIIALAAAALVAVIAIGGRK